jgi:hypothetical protein
MTPAEYRTVSDLLKRLHEENIVSDGAGASEKGERHSHLHMQCMLWFPKLNVNAEEVQKAMSELTYVHSDIPRGQNWHVFAVIHWPNECANVSWKTMVGYVIDCVLMCVSCLIPT